MSNKKYLVTGGTGFLGSALVKRLIQNGSDVRVLDNNWRGSTSKLGDHLKDIDFCEGDIRDLSVVEDAVSGVDVVIHMAYVNGTEHFYNRPDMVLEVGIKGVMNILDACKKHEVKELCLASSSEVYQTPPTIPTPEDVPLIIPDPQNPRYSYGGGKILYELLGLNYSHHFEKLTIFRPHNVYGPQMGYEHVVPQIAMKVMKAIGNSDSQDVQIEIQGDGSETRSFIYVDDFIDGLDLILSKGLHRNIYHIGTMDEISIADLCREIGTYFGKNLDIIPTPLQKGGTPRRCPDITKLRKLGFSPKTNLQTGLAQTLSWYAQNPSQ